MGVPGVIWGRGVPLAGLQLNHVIAEDIQRLPSDHGVAGLSQGRLNNQSLLIDLDVILRGVSQVTERTGGRPRRCQCRRVFDR
jgi:hypothetical protein